MINIKVINVIELSKYQIKTKFWYEFFWDSTEAILRFDWIFKGTHACEFLELLCYKIPDFWC